MKSTSTKMDRVATPALPPYEKSSHVQTAMRHAGWWGQDAAFFWNDPDQSIEEGRFYVDHAPHFILRFGRHVTGVACDNSESFQFTQRTACDVEKTQKLFLAPTACTFGDIRWDGHGGAAHLRCQAELLGMWE